MNGLLKRELAHGAQPPLGWKLSWYEPRRRISVFYPAPLHYFARAWRELSYRISLAWRAQTLEQRDVFNLQRVCREKEKLAAEYSRGYLSGWQDCFDEWVEALDQWTSDPVKH